jgi:predicted enzyme related to lactoylglutathione lyase
LLRIEFGIDCTELDSAAKFWSAALGYSVGDVDRANVYLDLIPPDPSLPVIFLQRVSRLRAAKNRTHLDLYVPDVEETVAQLRALGATSIGPYRTGSEGGCWQVMADLDGNEFCICQGP